MGKKKLAICAIFENAAAALPEWLAYHRVVGVEHFVLYDNASTDDPSRIVRNSPLAEHVTLIRWQQRPGQLAAYRHFIDIFAPGFEWAAFLGVDEFLLPLTGGTVLGALDFLDQAGAVVVHRRVFSPGPSPEPPPGLAIETYDRRAGDDFVASRHVRVIARCSDLFDVTQTRQEFRINGQVFDTAGRLAPNAAVQDVPCYRNLVVNHYCTGPRQVWLAALHQECAAGGGDVLAELSQVQDDAIRAFAPAVRHLLGLPPAEAPVPLPATTVSTPEPAVSPTEATPVIASPAPVVIPEEAIRVGQLTTGPTEPMPVAVPFEPPRPQPAMPAAVAVAVPFEAASFEQPSTTIITVPAEAAPGWIMRGEDAQERVGGTGLVFRDRSRTGDHWLAAVRGAAAAGIDPAFLVDDYDRIREFPDATQAREACDAALARAVRS